ncbi:MAG: DsrE family protein [Gemmatimonadetes bacterium]|nr:DsrE family protein [Gemmatimonadota bacterium]
MSKTLFILNDPPYGTERSYNGLRLAGSLARREGEQVKVFLIGDASSCAKRGQRVTKGYYNIETMLAALTLHKADIGVCGSCMDARGLADADLAEESRRSSMDELTTWTQWADRVLVF